MTAAPTTSLSGAPTADDLERWARADEEARPRRQDVLRARLEDEGLDAYFGVRRENSRYLTGFVLAEGEEKVAGDSGRFLVSRDEVVVLADSRYAAQAAAECPGARIEPAYHDLPARWPALLGSLQPIAGRGTHGLRRVAVEAGFVSHATWTRLAAAQPRVELVPVEGWVEESRATKEPAELERVAAAAAIADAALTRLLPQIRAGLREDELALQLEWEMRTHGAEALAFPVACLAGARAALPHGSPGSTRLRAGDVVLFDFGAQVAGYRSDMTRTLFVGTPRDADLAIYELVARAQRAAIDALEAAARVGEHPSGPTIDGIARSVIAEAGHSDHFGHGLGHGIGLATHESPSLGRTAADVPLPGPTVFSVEPGVYLDGMTGARIEDLLLFDPANRRCERLTHFPREVTVVG